MPEIEIPPLDEAKARAANASSIADIARSVEHDQIAERTAEKAKEAVLEALEQVFGYGDKPAGSQEMTILIRRIPLICQDVKQIHSDIADIKDNTKWVIRIIIGAVVIGLLGLLMPHLAISLP